jgi:imidazolonepropionase-like amidohydrolase
MPRTAFVGGTLIDGTGGEPIRDAAVVAEDGKIAWVGPASSLNRSPDLEEVDVSGKWVIPGMIDANIHLVLHIDPDVLLRVEPGQYDEMVLEAAQLSLKAGLTTVFDTWGPLEALRRTRDRINDGEVVGSRMYIAGNIIGNSGPWGPDFHPDAAATIGTSVVEQINWHWEYGTGPELTWMSADDVRMAVRKYIETSGIDFVKYASSAHKHGRFLAFSPDAQRAICEEAHAAGMTAQACTQTPEALKVTIEAGADLLQHGDVTGQRPMPEETLRRIAETQLPCVAFLTTEKRVDHMREERSMGEWTDIWLMKDVNDRALIDAGAKLMFAQDAGVFAPSWETSPLASRLLAGPEPTHLIGTAHLRWLEAAFERGMKPMDALLSVTKNIADGYRHDDIGTVEQGKRADLVVLDGNPLEEVKAYGRVARVVKDGELVDTSALPTKRVLTTA